MNKVDVRKLSFDIKKYIKDKKISGQKFANLCDTSSSTISRVMRCYGVDMDTLVRICYVLNQPVVDYFVDLMPGNISGGKTTLENARIILEKDETLTTKVREGLYELLSNAYSNIRSLAHE